MTVPRDLNRPSFRRFRDDTFFSQGDPQAQQQGAGEWKCWGCNNWPPIDWYVSGFFSYPRYRHNMRLIIFSFLLLQGKLFGLSTQVKISLT